MDRGAHEICASPLTLMGQVSLKSGESDGSGSARVRGEPAARVRVCQAWGVPCTVTRVPAESDGSRSTRGRGAPGTVARVQAGSDGLGSIRVREAPGTVMQVRV
eukprot:3320743-Rhodomonas_salina.1